MNKTIKTIILGLLPISGMMVFGWFNKTIFQHSDLGLTTRIILFLGSFMIGLGCWGIMAYLVENKLFAHLISLTSILALVIFIPYNYYTLIILLVIFLAFVFYYKNIQREKTARLKLILDASISPSLKALTFYLCLLVALNYYHSSLIPENAWQIPLKYQEKIISYILPGFNLEMTVDDLIYTIMARSEKIPVQQLSEYIVQKKKDFQPEFFSSYKKAMLEKLGVEDLNLTGEEKIKDTAMMKRIFEDQPNYYLQKYANFIGFGTLIVFFFSIVGLWRFTYPLIFLISWLFFKLFTKTGFVTIEKQQVTAEKLSL